jgi:DNA ligase (NAD+)
MESFIESIIECQTKEDIYYYYSKFRDSITFEDRSCLVLSLIQLIEEFDNLYYTSGDSPLCDECYDELVRLLCEDFHEIKAIMDKKVGSKTNGQEVELPFYMGSMNKMKNMKEIGLWCSKYSVSTATKDSSIKYVASAKLDGISALYHKGRLYSRGNGVKGRDISFLLPFLNLEEDKTRQTLRGELIMKKSTFANKYSEKYANSRNLICGILNRNFDPELHGFYDDIDFVIYDIYDDTMSPEMKFEILKSHHKKYNIDIVAHWSLDGGLTMDILDTLLMKWKKDYHYEIDGIILSHNNIYQLKTGENPRYSIAYKNNNLCINHVEAVVDKVIWNVSKDNYIKPKIKFETPVVCESSKIEYVTGFNAKYILENGIFKGSRVLVGLSGNVIPHIFQVLSSEIAKTIKGPLDIKGAIELGMTPTFEDVGSEYVWSKNRVDLILVDKNNVHSVIKRNMMFLKTMDIKCGLQETTLEKLYTQKGVYLLEDVLSLSLDEWISTDGIGEKKAQKFIETFHSKLDWSTIIQDKTNDEIQNIKYDYLLKYCVGSQSFSRGFAMKKVVAHLSCLQQLSLKNKDEFHISNMHDNGYIADHRSWIMMHINGGNFKGITNDSMYAFLHGFEVMNVLTFKLFLHKKLKNEAKIVIPSIETLLSYYDIPESNANPLPPPKTTNHDAKTFVFTGFRSKDLETLIKTKGHHVADALNKKTNYLVVKDKTKMSSKVKKAMDSGTIKILSIDEVVGVL